MRVGNFFSDIEMFVKPILNMWVHTPLPSLVLRQGSQQRQLFTAVPRSGLGLPNGGSSVVGPVVQSVNCRQ